MILIITNKEDAHPTPVIQLLQEQGVPIFRLNTEALLTDYSFSWIAKGGDIDFHIKCLQNSLEVKGSDITAIWERRPELPEELPYPSTKEIDKHNKDEALGFLQFLRFYLKDLPSIGSIVNDRIAASKMLQYRIAQSVGLTIPDTCFSNREEDILRFADGHKDMILKPIESSNIWDDNNKEQWVFYSQKCPSDSLCCLPDEAFSQTVSFLQPYIEKEFELRITVVGEKVFVTKINSQSLEESTGKVDWRQGYDHGIQFIECGLPDDVRIKCLAFLRKMGLSFGCFDFIVTPSGEYVFLECNPNGQWLWVEMATGQKISSAIADFFVQQETIKNA